MPDSSLYILWPHQNCWVVGENFGSKNSGSKSFVVGDSKNQAGNLAVAENPEDVEIDVLVENYYFDKNKEANYKCFVVGIL